MKIVFIQYGSFAEAYTRLSAGGPETYRDQKVSVDFVAGLAQSGPVTTIALDEPAEHDVLLAPGLRSIGLRGHNPPRARLAALLDELAPDALVCRTPLARALALARARRIPTLPTFADIFPRASGLRSRLRYLRLRRLLLGPQVPCIANHSLNASRSLVTALHLPRERIVPWDWSRLSTTQPAKAGPGDPAAPRAFFAGAVTAEKGVGDCLEALRRLHDRGLPLRMSFAGPGDLDAWRARASRMGLGDAATFLGMRPHDEVRALMNAHDIVVVPSRHSYAEGLPNTIYEGLASRSPLVLSDHPAFEGRLRPDREALFFRAEDPDSLAAALERLSRDRDLYADLSARSLEALEGLYVGIGWIELVSLFLSDPADRTGWTQRHALSLLEPEARAPVTRGGPAPRVGSLHGSRG